LEQRSIERRSGRYDVILRSRRGNAGPRGRYGLRELRNLGRTLRRTMDPNNARMLARDNDMSRRNRHAGAYEKQRRDQACSEPRCHLR
jgi:hypothetical protein